MLKIYFGDMPKAIYNTEIYFKNQYKDRWLLDPLVTEMIKDVDSSTVMSGKAILSQGKVFIIFRIALKKYMR